MGKCIYLLTENGVSIDKILKWPSVKPNKLFSNTVLKAWAMDNCKGEFSFFPQKNKWIFKLEEDAVAFKLMWS